MKRNWIVVLAFSLVILTLSGCRSLDRAYDEAAGASFKVHVLKAPTTVGMIKMMEPSIKPNLHMGDSVYYEIEENSEELYAKLQTGEIEIAVIPTVMAAKLYNDGAEYQIAAINTSGFMYVLASDVTIKNWSDLKGQKVSIADKGGDLDTMFKYLLMQNGIDPDKDMTLKHMSALEEQVQLVMNGDSKIAVLPEPLVSMVVSESEAYRIALDLQTEWIRVNGFDAPLAQTCIVVKSEVAVSNHEEFSLFLEDYVNSIEWVNQNPTETAKLVSKHDIGIAVNLAASVIPRSNLLFMSANDAKPAVEKYLEVFLELSPESIGGRMPDENFYYEK